MSRGRWSWLRYRWLRLRCYWRGWRLWRKLVGSTRRFKRSIERNGIDFTPLYDDPDWNFLRPPPDEVSQS